jgi:hypothetical protein
MLTLYGVLAVTFMMAMYGLERRGPAFVVAFTLGCLLSSVYGFLVGAWPFGVVQMIGRESPSGASCGSVDPC